MNDERTAVESAAADVTAGNFVITTATAQLNA